MGLRPEEVLGADEAQHVRRVNPDDGGLERRERPLGPSTPRPEQRSQWGPMRQLAAQLIDLWDYHKGWLFLVILLKKLPIGDARNELLTSISDSGVDMTEFYNFFILNIKSLMIFSTAIGVYLLADVLLDNSRWLKEKYLSMVVLTVNWAFPLVILSKAGESILDRAPTNDSLFIFLFQLIMNMVILGLVPLLISYIFRKKFTIEKTYYLLVSIWYFIWVIPQLNLLYGWFDILKGFFS